jgi:CheY-like chemotaxis protein
MRSEGVILLAEDTEDDVLLIRRALFKGGVSNPVQVVRNGAEAISYLKGEAEFTDRDEYPLPELMLLDLKMPIVDGFEVLRWVRRQPLLAALRVLVLTSSDSLRDVNLAYRLGANSFLVKPFEFEDCLQLGQAIREYWLGHNLAGEISRPARNPHTESLRNPLRDIWTS